MNKFVIGWRILFLVILTSLLLLGGISRNIFFAVILGIIIFSIIPEVYSKKLGDK
ncbi:hypothetical protein HMPREF1210_02845 [Paenisporosarcina sp. HGH0030]|nr:hypothetical protein HMPREF1210_02845 [Paenisporosarcina sp. HGH0030]